MLSMGLHFASESTALYSRALFAALSLPPYLIGRLVLAETDVNRVAQEVVGRPCQKGDLGDKFRLDPMNARQHKRRAETSPAWRQHVKGRRLAGERVETAPQIGEDFVRHPRAHAAGVNELAVVGIVAQQERPEMRPRSFRLRPANDNELLPLQPFGFTPQTAVPRRIGRIDRFGDDAFKPELYGVQYQLGDNPDKDQPGYSDCWQQKTYEDNIVASRVGDPIKLCLVSIPLHCPKGDGRGREYAALDLRNHRWWNLGDSEHMCGGT
jgi:hypothetical protein